MYGIFYMSHMLFGGIGTILGGVTIMDVFRRREELHTSQLLAVTNTQYWNGYDDGHTNGYSEGQRDMLSTCQALAIETILMSTDSPQTQALFAEVVKCWPEFALPQEVTPYQPPQF